MVTGHIVGASASLLGPYSSGEISRTRYIIYHHRASGKVFCDWSDGSCGFMCCINLMYDCEACRVSLGILSIIWFACTSAAWWAVRHKNIKAHQQFMARSYTAALAFVFIRLFPIVGYTNIFLFWNTKLEQRITAEWLCWVIPLLIVEVYLVWWPSINGQAAQKIKYYYETLTICYITLYTLGVAPSTTTTPTTLKAIIITLPMYRAVMRQNFYIQHLPPPKLMTGIGSSKMKIEN
ncbi:MAG: DUF2306 domain-containing protein [Spirosomataceae bacterium]